MEGREVLPIKADGDGFAQEVRLHLFYSNQSNAFFSWWPGNLRPGQGLVAISNLSHFLRTIIKSNLPCSAKTSDKEFWPRLTNEC